MEITSTLLTAVAAISAVFAGFAGSVVSVFAAGAVAVVAAGGAVAAGGVAAVLNTRHAIAKENGWKEQAPTQAAFIAAVQEQSNVIRRPILVNGDTAVVGKDVEQIRSLLS